VTPASSRDLRESLNGIPPTDLKKTTTEEREERKGEEKRDGLMLLSLNRRGKGKAKVLKTTRA